MKQHLLSRHLNPDRYSGVFVTEDATTFMLWNLTGQCVGWHVYRPSGDKKARAQEDMKYFTRVLSEGDNRSRKALAVWGLETYRLNQTLYLTEGIFDAASLHTLGLPAVAVLANDPKPLKSWLNLLPNKTVAVLDGDDAGNRLGKLCDSRIVCPSGEDPNSMELNALKGMIT